MKSKNTPPLIHHVSVEELKETFTKAQDFIQQARYRQAIALLNQTLAAGLTLMEQLRCLSFRGYAYSLWKKPSDAIDDISRLLKLVKAEVNDLTAHEIDWDLEIAEDTGYLTFLSALYHLRGTLRRVQERFPEAVEDLTLSLYMTRDPEFQAMAFLQRGCALIQLKECTDRALLDLNQAYQLSPQSVRDFLHIPEKIQTPDFYLKSHALWVKDAQNEAETFKIGLALKLSDIKEEILLFSRVAR